MSDEWWPSEGELRRLRELQQPGEGYDDVIRRGLRLLEDEVREREVYDEMYRRARTETSDQDQGPDPVATPQPSPETTSVPAPDKPFAASLPQIMAEIGRVGHRLRDAERRLESMSGCSHRMALGMDLLLAHHGLTDDADVPDNVNQAHNPRATTPRSPMRVRLSRLPVETLAYAAASLLIDAVRDAWKARAAPGRPA